MPNSPKRRSRFANTKPETREELSRLFWESGAIDNFARGLGNITYVAWRPPLSYEEFSDIAFGEAAPIAYPTYEFWLEVIHFGQEQWVAVSCNGMVVVAPFLRPLVYSDWPCYPEDIDRV